LRQVLREAEKKDQRRDDDDAAANANQSTEHAGDETQKDVWKYACHSDSLYCVP
jgi:hypothetical protein